ITGNNLIAKDHRHYDQVLFRTIPGRAMKHMDIASHQRKRCRRNIDSDLKLPVASGAITGHEMSCDFVMAFTNPILKIRFESTPCGSCNLNGVADDVIRLRLLNIDTHD